jgi:hypothetical protein
MNLSYQRSFGGRLFGYAHAGRCCRPAELGDPAACDPSSSGRAGRACHPVVVGLVHEVRACGHYYEQAPPGRTMIPQGRAACSDARPTARRLSWDRPDSVARLTGAAVPFRRYGRSARSQCPYFRNASACDVSTVAAYWRASYAMNGPSALPLRTRLPSWRSRARRTIQSGRSTKVPTARVAQASHMRMN